MAMQGKRKGGEPQGKSFEIKMRMDVPMNPSQAFNNMCDMAHEKHGNFEQVRARFFRIVLRPVDIPLQAFVEGKIERSNVDSPIFCLPVYDGYLFFGKMRE